MAHLIDPHGSAVSTAMLLLAIGLGRLRRGRRTMVALAIIAFSAIAWPLRAQRPDSAVARITVTVTQGEEGPLQGARVRAGGSQATTDTAGRASLHVPVGETLVVATKLGFRPESVVVNLSAGTDTAIALALVERAATLASIIVSSTRAERRLEEEPLRVEVLGGEDIGEKNEMHPADSRSLLREMSGVRVQNTSASFNAAAVRIQGLRGRQTLLLNDGLPLYGTQSGGFGLAQLAPLDLRQVEVIKGAASALYGSSALGGVVNLLSRRPPDTSSVMVNQTARRGTDVLVFAARPLPDSGGFTIMAGAHRQPLLDPHGEGVASIVGVERVEARPRYFRNGDDGTLMLTAGGFAERRAGGVTADPDSLVTNHVDAGVVRVWTLGETHTASVRASASQQLRHRRIERGEDERLRNGFAEGSLTRTTERHTLVMGAAVQSDGYRNEQAARFDGTLTVSSLFAQETISPNDWLSGTINGRCDATGSFGVICTPRLSILTRIADVLSARFSVGAGWSAPRPLTDETEGTGLTRIQAMGDLSPERARTASMDVTGTTGPLQASGTVFVNTVMNPVVLVPTPDPALPRRFENAGGPAHVHGGELFAVYNAEPIIATAYWASVRSSEPRPGAGGRREMPYTPRTTAGLDLAFEEDESATYVAGEVFYTGRQTTEDDPFLRSSPSYVELGVLFSQGIGHVTVFANGENLTNVRQGEHEPLRLPARDDLGRRLVPAWGPIEGRSVNLGARVRF